MSFQKICFNSASRLRPSPSVTSSHIEVEQRFSACLPTKCLHQAQSFQTWSFYTARTSLVPISDLVNLRVSQLLKIFSCYRFDRRSLPSASLPEYHYDDGWLVSSEICWIGSLDVDQAAVTEGLGIYKSVESWRMSATVRTLPC